MGVIFFLSPLSHLLGNSFCNTLLYRFLFMQLVEKESSKTGEATFSGRWGVAGTVIFLFTPGRKPIGI